MSVSAVHGLQMTENDIKVLRVTWCQNIQESNHMAAQTTRQVVSLHKEIFEQWSMDSYGDKDNEENIRMRILKRYGVPLMAFLEGLIISLEKMDDAGKKHTATLIDQCGRRHARYIKFTKITHEEFRAVGMVMAVNIRNVIAERSSTNVGGAGTTDGLWVNLFHAVVDDLYKAYAIECKKVKFKENPAFQRRLTDTSYCVMCQYLMS